MEKTESSVEEVAKRLLKFRTVLDLTQKDFAKLIGVTASQYNDWEKGRARVSLEGALKIHSAFGLPLDWIYLNKVEALTHRMAIQLS